MAAGRCESAPDRIGPITLDAKQTGKRSAGDPHAAFEVAGAGDVTMGAGLRTNAKAVGATTGPYRRRASPRPNRRRLSAGAGAPAGVALARGSAYDRGAARRPHRAGGARPPRPEPAALRARTGRGAAQGESQPAPAAKEQAAPEPAHAVTVQDEMIPAGTTPTPEGKPHPAPTSVPSPTRQEAPDRRAAARTKPPGAVTSTAKPRASGRSIPAAMRRQVWQRDGSRCSYVDPQTGRRCNSRHLIEIDHILPYALGGGADPANLRLLCHAHHRHRHAPHG